MFCPEWQRSGKAKQPYCFEVNDGELFAFAGLWDRWKDPGGHWIKSFSILTTTPNAVTSAAPEEKQIEWARHPQLMKHVEEWRAKAHRPLRAGVQRQPSK
jgi:hypothetical protein